MQRITMRLMVNVIVAISIIYVLASLKGFINSGHCKLVSLVIVALLTVGIKNNIRSNRAKMVMTIVGSASAILIFLLVS